MEKKKLDARLKKYEESKILSRVLYHLTSATDFHRAYTLEEILDACDALGFHPSDVNNRSIGFVLNWLKENKN